MQPPIADITKWLNWRDQMLKGTLMKSQWLRDPDSPDWTRWFLGWLSMSLILHLICTYFSVGYHSIDEYFQILEFLNFKLGQSPESALPVEFAERMRPWLQPAFYYLKV